MKISASSTFFLTVCGLASRAAASNIWQRTYNALDVLIPRQTSGTGVDPSQIPTQCQTQCTTVLNTISTCTTDSCICTTDNANEMESCVNCLISLDPTEDMIEEGNEILSCECRLELYRNSSVLLFLYSFLYLSIHLMTTTTYGCFLKALSEECATVSGFPTLSISASTTASDDTSSVSFTALSSDTSSKSQVVATTQKSTATGTSTATSSAESESTSGSGIKGLNGAVLYKGSMAQAVVGVLGVVAGAGLLRL
ncbi:hypothetical protein DFJ43DRAFT_54408 [Lentinula guzmanii]|uniref:Extracellular membrane protein CFEM domain-containing protein n=1 Tax=Lentinula guzmanii TaxID=2804957 RepID=A0AA38J6N1_9AGAR|nr:hypothetical protein DFJ43DRAFT_54408 [Lentinula guzmanii]